jgi:hypothetical protein
MSLGAVLVAKSTQHTAQAFCVVETGATGVTGTGFSGKGLFEVLGAALGATTDAALFATNCQRRTNLGQTWSTSK